LNKKEAIKIYKDILKVDSQHIKTHISLARLAFGNSDWNDLAFHLDSIPESIKTTNLYLLEARMFEKLGSIEKANSLYLNIVKKDPSFVRGFEGLLRTCKSLSIDLRVLELGEKLIDTVGTHNINPYLLRRIGELHLKFKNYDLAKKRLLKAKRFSEFDNHTKELLNQVNEKRKRGVIEK